MQPNLPPSLAGRRTLPSSAARAASVVTAPAVLQTPEPQVVREVAPRGPQALPDFGFSDDTVNATSHVASGTNLYLMVGYVVVLGGALFATLASMGGFLILLGIGAFTAWLQARRVRAMIRGSGVAVSEAQLPELQSLVEKFSARLGIKEVPELYIVEDSVQNGFAVKLGKRNLVLLTDDVVWGTLQSRDPRALGFVIAHELAHIALGHTGGVRSIIRNMFPPLSRADELSADNVAAALVDDAKVAVHGLALLTVGPQLMGYINDEALLAQAREVAANKLSKKAEQTMKHPLLLRRIANVAQGL